MKALLCRVQEKKVIPGEVWGRESCWQGVPHSTEAVPAGFGVTLPLWSLPRPPEHSSALERLSGDPPGVMLQRGPPLPLADCSCGFGVTLPLWGPASLSPRTLFSFRAVIWSFQCSKQLPKSTVFQSL